MGRLFRHLCLVTKHYNERESARLDLNEDLDKLSDRGMQDEALDISQRMNELLDKELKVADHHYKANQKHKPTSVAVHGVRTIVLGSEDGRGLSKRIKGIERKVDKKYKERLVQELRDKLFYLEAQLRDTSGMTMFEKEQAKSLRLKIRRLKKILQN